MVFSAERQEHLWAECGVSQIVTGTDYPFAWSETVIDHVLRTPGLSRNAKRPIPGQNAARLLNVQT